jgi:predicted kinase
VPADHPIRAVIIDATFQRHKQREPFLALAHAANIPCVIVHTTASTKTLQQRIRERRQRNNDASDADLHVLDLQQRDWEPLSAMEQRHVIEVNTDEPIDLARITAEIQSR